MEGGGYDFGENIYTLLDAEVNIFKKCLYYTKVGVQPT